MPDVYAALRIAGDFGCAAIGIQYQQGLKDICPASDLAEGLLNNVDRPPVKSATTGEALYSGNALPHFNEVDECAGVDALITNRVWRKLGLDPETTLHDVRYGEEYENQFVWTLEISGPCPHNTSSTDTAERLANVNLDVFPLRWRNTERNQQAWGNCLEPDLRAKR